MYNKKNIVLVLGIVLTLILTISISYAFFYYVGEGDEISLTSGNISIDFSEEINYISLGNSYPKSDMMGKIDPNYYDFVITGIRGEKDNIHYEIQIEEESGNTLDEKYIKVYLTDQNNNSITSPKVLTDLAVSKYNNNRVIYEDLIWKETDTQNYRLRVWVDSSYTENVLKTFNFKVKLYAVNEKGGQLLCDVVEENLSFNLLEDDGDSRIVSGNNDINNYVWYSGKLWRIVSLNNDGSIKLVTDENITSIYWGENITYEGSWIYQWLNEDFKDTLYNYEELLVTDYKWNSTITKGSNKPAKTTMIEAPIGLLTYYEYAGSKSKALSAEDGYLNNGYYWWTLTPYDSTYVCYIYNNGNSSYSYPTKYANGVRPAINLNSNVQINGGNGSKSNPYRLIGDIKETIYLNERVSGEYVNFDNELYRIVSIEDEIIKITKVDYIRDNSDNVLTKNFASSVTFCKGTNTKNNDYWDYYLNNTWYNNLSPKYKNMLIKGTWYLGSVSSTYASYKSAICEIGNTTELTKFCKKTKNIYDGYVGLGRIGEMFTSNFGDGYDTSSTVWTLTPYSGLNVWGVYFNGIANNSYRTTSYKHSARPSINLKSNIRLVSGEGTKESPFEISE